MNYYELFGIPVRPVVNGSELARKYFELQKQNHPDFFSQATEHEQEGALELSATINKAFTTFKDEQKTLEYFLQLKGLLATDEKYELPQDFLMDMLDLNEELTDAGPSDMVEKVRMLEKSLYEQVKPTMENYSDTTPDTVLQELKEYYYKKKYLNRILDRLGD
jgi:molecular chaperone HscB